MVTGRPNLTAAPQREKTYVSVRVFLCLKNIESFKSFSHKNQYIDDGGLDLPSLCLAADMIAANAVSLFELTDAESEKLI